MKDQEIVKESEKILESLFEIIKNEQQALVKVDEEILVEIVPQKNNLLDSLSRHQLRLSKILQDDNGPKTAKIRGLLTQCQALNLQNRQVGHLGLTVVNKSLEILQSAMHIASAKTYSPEGKKSTASRKRHLGVV